MAFQVGHRPALRGKVAAVQPIKNPAQIEAIKDLLADKPRELAIFLFGINAAFRCGDMLRIERTDLQDLPDGRYRVAVLESKTKKTRVVDLNHPTSQALRAHLETSSGRYLFEGQRGKLSVQTVGRMIKKWAAEVGVTERVATHTLRKTFARARLDRGAQITTLMYALNHDSPRQTLGYLGIIQEDVAALYAEAV